MYVILGILGLLVGLLFLFVRQKIYSFEHRLNLLTDTIQTIAGLNVQSIKEDEEEEEDEDEDEEEEEEEDEDEKEEVFPFKTIRLESIGPLEPLEPLKFEFNFEPAVELTNPEIQEINEPMEMVESKVITLERVVSDDIYEKMTVKELKEKVSEVDGPKFKTKKEMIDFLKSR